MKRDEIFANPPDTFAEYRKRSNERFKKETEDLMSRDPREDYHSDDENIELLLFLESVHREADFDRFGKCPECGEPDEKFHKCLAKE